MVGSSTLLVLVAVLACAVAQPARFAALQDLYNSTHGSGWLRNAGWPAGDPCGWYGITCENTTIVGIDLTNNNLAGTLPGSLNTLNFLKKLKLGDNEDLSGLIPNYSNLINLEELSLNNTGLEDVFPDWVVQLPHLASIELSHNRITGTIPGNIGNLVSLQRLIMHDTDLEGTLPDSLGQLTNLLEIDFGNNQIIGPIPHALFGMSKIETIYFASNYLNGSIPEWLSPTNMSKLHNLDLRCNLFESPLPAWLKTDPEVEYHVSVHFGCNDIFDDALPDWCVKQDRCGPNSCSGLRCTKRSELGNTTIVLIALASFFVVVFVGNVVFLIRKKCLSKPEPTTEMEPFLRDTLRDSVQ